MKPISRKDFLASLVKEGWVFDRNNGKHDVFVHNKSTKHIAVPHGVEVSVGIIRQTTPTRMAVKSIKGKI